MRAETDKNITKTSNREKVKIVRNAARTFFPVAIAALVCLLFTALTSTPVQAQTYTRLQVLLPGEVIAPGTTSGKAGTPVAQAAGVPFTVRIRACDDTWNTVTSITHSRRYIKRWY